MDSPSVIERVVRVYLGRPVFPKIIRMRSNDRFVLVPQKRAWEKTRTLPYDRTHPLGEIRFLMPVSSSLGILRRFLFTGAALLTVLPAAAAPLRFAAMEMPKPDPCLPFITETHAWLNENYRGFGDTCG